MSPVLADGRLRDALLPGYSGDALAVVAALLDR